MHHPQKKIVVALSGGVDSAVAAALLREQGWQVLGVHLWLADTPGQPRDLTALSEFLGIRWRQVDFRQEFNAAVIDNFLSQYRSGKTPNPCVQCNARIKFGHLLQLIRSWGYEYLATGHYARIAPGEDGQGALWRGLDGVKEQSYFLHRLPRTALPSLVLPLGSHNKTRVRELSGELGLAPLLPSRESQELCFVPGSYVDFIHARGETGSNRPGPIVNLRGEELGTHRGLEHYTVGQRQGLGVPAPAPLYVLAIQPAGNRLVVGFKAELSAGGVEVEDINWLLPVPEAPLPVQVRLRYRHPGVDCRLEPLPGNRARLILAQPQTAVAPGQAAVFYRGDRVLGGGWIVRGFNP